MKNRLIYFLIVSLCFVGFASCSDDEDTNIKFYASSEAVNTVSVTTIGTITVEVRNIKGAFTVKSNNEALATVSVNPSIALGVADGYSILAISGIKEGSTTITVTDSENRSATLNVEVVIQTLSMLITKHETLIEAVSPTTVDEAAVEKIKNEIIGKLPLVGGGFKLSYTSDYAGTLIYYPDTKKLTEKKEGTFKWDGDEATGRMVLKLYYNDVEYMYKYGSNSDLSTRSSPPAQLYLTIDFTDNYSQMTKPKITKAIGAILVTDGKGF